MLKRIAFGLLFAVIGYCLGTFGGMILIEADLVQPARSIG